MEGFIWLGLIVLGIVIEAASPQLVAVWFVLGAVAALISSFFGIEIWVQVVIALAVTAVTLVATRPLVKKVMINKTEKTNADRYIGCEGIVTSDIDDISGTGRVTVMGSSWSAYSEEGKTIREGTKVIVQGIKGVKLSVKAEE